MTSPHQDPTDEVGAEISALELWLGEGTDDARAALRQRIANDPLQALEMAETVALLEEFRQLRVESSARLHCMMADVLHRARRRVGTRTPEPFPAIAWAVAAAAVVAGLLRWIDPLSGAVPARTPLAGIRLAAVDPPSEPAAGSDALVRSAAAVQWESTVERMRQRLGLEGSDRLAEALESGLREPVDSLDRWLDPRNALARLQLEHERRGSDEERAAAVRRAGGMVGTDQRAQQLADEIASELTTRITHGEREPSVVEVGFAVRALIAAGSSSPHRSRAVTIGSDWLAERVGSASASELVEALCALVEVVAVRGTHEHVVRAAGQRLVDDVLRADEDTWGRWRPELLAGRVPPAAMADAARLLALLPGLGVDPERSGLVRRLVLGHLRERRQQAEGEGPEVLAAMVFGCADLLPEAERDEIERQLRRWNVTRLVPDYATVMQIVCGLEPGRLGFTRLQRDLRRLAVSSEPSRLVDRAAFCLCLTSSYAGWNGAVPPRHGLGD